MVHLPASLIARRWPAGLVALVLCLASWSALAGGFNVTPVRVTFAGPAKTMSLQLENQSDDEVLIQSELLAWTQANGADQLQPTQDLVVSPPIFKIPGHGTQTIRLALLRPAAGNAEASYRLFLTEVPPPAKAGQPSVAFALKIGLPVFVQPKPALAPSLDWKVHQASQGSLLVTLSNQGSAHTQVQDLHLLSAGGTDVASDKLNSYVLPGQARSWTLSSQGSWRGQTLNLSGHADSGDFRASVVVD